MSERLSKEKKLSNAGILVIFDEIEKWCYDQHPKRHELDLCIAQGRRLIECYETAAVAEIDALRDENRKLREREKEAGEPAGALTGVRNGFIAELDHLLAAHPPKPLPVDVAKLVAKAREWGECDEYHQPLMEKLTAALESQARALATVRYLLGEEMLPTNVPLWYINQLRVAVGLSHIEAPATPATCWEIAVKAPTDATEAGSNYQTAPADAPASRERALRLLKDSLPYERRLSAEGLLDALQRLWLTDIEARAAARKP